ncbi:MAG: V-type proton ATPase subunit E [Dictyoglomus thermophilum]|nr:V-type proton ATPase subunit E [Dictyoglomus thermophilum]MCX7719870.1 V-type proton ATPase subunit E [Dictyoglomus thermophilum]
MSLERIVERLETEKRTKIEEIKNKKEKEFQEFVAKKEKELEEWKEKQKRSLKEKLNREENTLAAQLKLKYNAEKLRIESDAIAKVKNLVLERLKSSSNEVYNKIWENLLERESIKSGEMILTKNEDKIDVDYFCKKYSLTLSKDRIEGNGGFVIQKDNLVIDLTVDTIIEELVNKNILEIAQILHGER